MRKPVAITQANLSTNSKQWMGKLDLLFLDQVAISIEVWVYFRKVYICTILCFYWNSSFEYIHIDIKMDEAARALEYDLFIEYMKIVRSN